jgi:hypothetical protein
VYLKGPLFTNRTGEANGTGVPLPIGEMIEQTKKEKRPTEMPPIPKDTSQIHGIAMVADVAIQ